MQPDHNDSTGAILAFVSETAQTRMRTVGLTPEDAVTIGRFRDELRPKFLEIIDDFYTEVTSHPPLREIISRSTTIDRLKMAFFLYLVELFSGIYDVDYCLKRVKVGLTHSRVGLDLTWYLGLYAKLRGLLFPALQKHFQDQNAYLLLRDALDRLIALDQLLAVDAYHLAFTDKLRDEVKRANKGEEAKARFLASMSHELRTPLNSILGFSELLLKKFSTIDQTVAKHLEAIQRNGTHLLTMINDILDIAKADAGELKLRIETGSVVQLCEDICSSLEHLLQGRPVTIKKNFADAPTSIRIDFGKVRQILLNLISNAAKFTEQGTITVSAESAGDTLTFKVADTGIGIAVDHLKEIFVEYRQIEALNPSGSKGTGLGLALCGRLAKTMNGEVKVASKAGSGTVFTLVIPVDK